MTDKCSICLEDLHRDIGVAIPCGHCFHRICFDSLRSDFASRLGDDRGGPRGAAVPRCPVCKKKAEKFCDAFLTFQRREEGPCGSGCADAMEAVAALTGENVRLNGQLREMKSLSKDQSELLIRIVPQYDELESKVSRIRRDKKDLLRTMRELSEENSALLSEWNDAEVQLEHIMAKTKQVERRLKETDEENLDLHSIWDELDSQLFRAKRKRKEAKIALKRKADELDGTISQVSRANREKKRLKESLDQCAQETAKWRSETLKLRKKIKKMKKKERGKPVQS